MWRAFVLPMFFGMAVLLSGCGRGAAPTPGPRGAPPSGALVVRLEGTEFKWDSDRVTVRAGQRVRFQVVNKGAIAHTFLSDPAGIPETKEIPPGGEIAVEWTAPPRPATFEFWCGVPGHREAGMTGQLIVTAP